MWKMTANAFEEDRMNAIDAGMENCSRHLPDICENGFLILPFLVNIVVFVGIGRQFGNFIL